MDGLSADSHQSAGDDFSPRHDDESVVEVNASATPRDDEQRSTSPQLVSFGLISFLLEPAAILRWFQLSVLAFFVLMFASYALYFGDSVGAQKMFAVLMLLFLVPAGLMFVYLASVSSLVIVEDTANGYQTVQSWPGIEFFDWIDRAFYVINALAFSMLPGALIGHLAAFGGEYLPATIALGSISGFFLFPLMLLSMIVQESPMAAAAPVVLRSVRTLTGVWKKFYLVSAVLASLFLLAILLASTRGFILLGLASMGTVTFAMVYCRLLGRLAGIILQHDAESPTESTPAANVDSGGDE